MRKLIAILSGLTIAATTTSTVISCGTQLNDQTGNWDINGAVHNYTARLVEDELVSYITNQDDPNYINKYYGEDIKVGNMFTIMDLLASVATNEGLIPAEKPIDEDEEQTEEESDANKVYALEQDAFQTIFKKMIVHASTNENSLINKINTFFEEDVFKTEKKYGLMISLNNSSSSPLSGDAEKFAKGYSLISPDDDYETIVEKFKSALNNNEQITFHIRIGLIDPESETEENTKQKPVMDIPVTLVFDQIY
ncbi:lipoprotein [Mesoplasma photuris]|uniref:lipoprotein n=1 Tax=Mesoplasma photuris TaxID=217731 RepID=UPI0004E0BDB0|nr:lipoprotein [Mesoplasma photuris]